MIMDLLSSDTRGRTAERKKLALWTCTGPAARPFFPAALKAWQAGGALELDLGAKCLIRQINRSVALDPTLGVYWMWRHARF